MAKQESTVFKVGDVVSLKVQPEFRGGIENFWEKNFSGNLKGATISETGYDALEQKNLWVDILHLDEKYVTKRITVSILHLAFPG